MRHELKGGGGASRCLAGGFSCGFGRSLFFVWLLDHFADVAEFVDLTHFADGIEIVITDRANHFLDHWLDLPSHGGLGFLKLRRKIDLGWFAH